MWFGFFLVPQFFQDRLSHQLYIVLYFDKNLLFLWMFLCVIKLVFLFCVIPLALLYHWSLFFVVSQFYLGLILIAVVVHVQTIPMSNASRFRKEKYIGQGCEASSTSNLSMTSTKLLWLYSRFWSSRFECHFCTSIVGLQDEFIVGRRSNLGISRIVRRN